MCSSSGHTLVAIVAAAVAVIGMRLAQPHIGAGCESRLASRTGRDSVRRRRGPGRRGYSRARCRRGTRSPRSQPDPVIAGEARRRLCVRVSSTQALACNGAQHAKRIHRRREHRRRRARDTRNTGRDRCRARGDCADTDGCTDAAARRACRAAHRDPTPARPVEADHYARAQEASGRRGSSIPRWPSDEAISLRQHAIEARNLVGLGVPALGSTRSRRLAVAAGAGARTEQQPGTDVSPRGRRRSRSPLTKGTTSARRADSDPADAIPTAVRTRATTYQTPQPWVQDKVSAAARVQMAAAAIRIRSETIRSLSNRRRPSQAGSVHRRPRRLPPSPNSPIGRMPATDVFAAPPTAAMNSARRLRRACTDRRPARVTRSAIRRRQSVSAIPWRVRPASVARSPRRSKGALRARPGISCRPVAEYHNCPPCARAARAPRSSAYESRSRARPVATRARRASFKCRIARAAKRMSMRRIGATSSSASRPQWSVASRHRWSRARGRMCAPLILLIGSIVALGLGALVGGLFKSLAIARGSGHLVLNGEDGDDHLSVDDSTDGTGDRVTITDHEIAPSPATISSARADM